MGGLSRNGRDILFYYEPISRYEEWHFGKLLLYLIIYFGNTWIIYQRDRWDKSRCLLCPQIGKGFFPPQSGDVFWYVLGITFVVL